MNSNAKASYGAGVCFLLWAAVSGAELAWGLFFMVVVLMVLLKLLLLYWARRLSCSVELRTHGAPRHGAFEITYVLANNGLLPIPECRLSVHLEKELGVIELPSEYLAFAVSEIKALKKECRCPRRGIYSVGGATVTLTDPLGMQQKQARFDRQVTVEVFPRIYPMTALLDSGHDEGGALRGRGQADQDYTSISRIRPALPQETARHIHWKASARTEELQVCEYEARKRRGVTVLLDSNGEKFAEDPEGRMEERCVEVAAGLAVHWLGRGYEVELIAGAGPALRLKGADSLNLALRALMRFRPEAHAPMTRTLPQLQRLTPPGAILQIVTPALDISEHALLKGHPGGRVSVFLIGAGESPGPSPLPIVHIPVETAEAI